MLNAQSEFDRRKSEIDEYVSHLEALEQAGGISVTLISTMKSSALLMMYNLVESTMTNLMQDVFDHLKTRGIMFDSLNDTMKEVVLNYSKKRSASDMVKRMEADAISLVVACFDRSDVFSGNIDCRKIKETFKTFGIPTRHRYSEPVLLTVKSERNNLAHGNKSFSECGRDYSATDLREHKEKVNTVLVRVIDDFENFLDVAAYS